MGRKNIDMPPDALALMESTRAIGYSLATAVADVIDNSIAAGSSQVMIDYIPTNGGYVAILDNGCGMNSDELNQAMKYGGRGPHTERSKDDLGRFGLGLKTASLSQCDCLTVISRQQGQTEGRCWDLDYIKKSGCWSLLVLEEAELAELPLYQKLCQQKQGTLVIWQQLDRLCQGDDLLHVLTHKMDTVKGHLALVFHRYLKGEKGIKKLEILMNNVSLEPSSPFLDEMGTKCGDRIIQRFGDKDKIESIPYLLPHPNKIREQENKLLGITCDLQHSQGFYVYRNKRLIIWGTWFHKVPKDKISKLSRIQVDIPSSMDDEWMLDVKKSSALPPKKVVERLDSLVEKLTNKSRKVYTYRGKQETDKNLEHIWKRICDREGNVRYEVNAAHPLVQSLNDDLSSSGRRKLKSLLHIIEGMIPINQMLLDANDSSRSLENETMMSQDDAKKALSLLTKGLPAPQLHMLLERLKKTEPFCKYPELFVD